MKRYLNILRSPLLAAVLFSVSGCSSLTSIPAQKAPDTAPDISPTTESTTIETTGKLPPAPMYGEFEPDTLYALLTAEIAAQRGRFDITLLNYVQQARKVKDINIIKRALQVAQYLKAENAQFELSKTWLEVEPDNEEAMQLGAYFYTKRKDYEHAVELMERILEHGGHADLDRLAIHSKNLPEAEQDQLFALYQSLQKRHPDNKEVVYSLAVMEKNRGNPDKGLAIIQPLMDKDPDYEPGIILMATLFYDNKQLTEAATLLESATKRFPKNRKMGTVYARLLIDLKDLDAAQSVFEDLMERFPEESELKLSYALVSMEKGDDEIAETQLKALLEEGEHQNDGRYYLGRLAEKHSDNALAIRYYSQIDGGTHFYSAISRAVFIQSEENGIGPAIQQLDAMREKLKGQEENLWLIEIDLLLDLEDYEAAEVSINAALLDYPDNTRLLYSRAMIYDRAEHLDAMETDLRRVIELEPQNAIALNALGYTLADKTERLLEAFELISKAHQLSPENPAILDSMGWAYYRMGDTAEALNYLNQAFANFPDPEVAAHLGEVLWMSDKKEKALSIWIDILSKHPKDKLIPKTMQRLGASIPEDLQETINKATKEHQVENH